MNSEEPTKKKSISGNVYKTLKSRIYNLEYRPGRSLSVASLSKELEISRSPVRDALQHLAQENLVQIFPKSGTRVSLINIHLMEEERFVRKSLELSALKEMFYDSTTPILEAMEESIERQKSIDFKNDLINFLKEDDAFHKLIFKSINKEDCWGLAKNFTPNEHRVRLLIDKSIIKSNENIIQNHLDLFNAIKARNIESALAVDSKHLGKINYEIVTLMSNYPDLFEADSSKSNSPVPSKIRDVVSGNENFLNTIMSY